NRGEIEHTEGARSGIERPGDAAQYAASDDHPARTEPVDQVPFGGHQPRLEQYEYGEGGLDGRLAPSKLVADRADEQRPAILKVGDHHHADDPDDQLRPWVGKC